MANHGVPWIITHSFITGPRNNNPPSRYTRAYQIQLAAWGRSCLSCSSAAPAPMNMTCYLAELSTSASAEPFISASCISRLRMRFVPALLGAKSLRQLVWTASSKAIPTACIRKKRKDTRMGKWQAGGHIDKNVHHARCKKCEKKMSITSKNRFTAQPKNFLHNIGGKITESLAKLFDARKTCPGMLSYNSHALRIILSDSRPELSDRIWISLWPHQGVPPWNLC